MVQTGAMLHDVFERDRVRNGLVEAITKLCKNGLSYNSELCVEGLLGITLDNKEVLLVNIKEIIKAKKDEGFYKNSFGSETFSSSDGSSSLYDKPLDFSSKIRCSTNKDSSLSPGTCPEQRPVRGSRKRKPKHISETIILDNEDEEVLVEGTPIHFQPNAVVDFSTKSCKPQVPIATPVKRTQEANVYAVRGTPSPMGRGSGSPCPGPPSAPSPSSPTISGSKSASAAISNNSSIPQATTSLVTPIAKKPKVMQGSLNNNNNSVQLHNAQKGKNNSTVPQQQQRLLGQQDVAVQNKIGNLVQNAVDNVIERVHSNLVVQSQSSSANSNTDSLQNALETAVRSAHADRFHHKHDNIARGGVMAEGPPSPSDGSGRLIIVEPSGDGDNDDDDKSNHDDNTDYHGNSDNNVSSRNNGVKKEDDVLSSCSSSRSLQTTPDPCKQQSVSISIGAQLNVPMV